MLREKLRVVRWSTSIHHAADWRCGSDMSLAKSSWDLLRNERRRNQELKEGQQPRYWARRHGLRFRGRCAAGIFCGFESPGIEASLEVRPFIFLVGVQRGGVVNHNIQYVCRKIFIFLIRAKRFGVINIRSWSLIYISMQLLYSKWKIKSSAMTQHWKIK